MRQDKYRRGYDENALASPLSHMGFITKSLLNGSSIGIAFPFLKHVTDGEAINANV